MTSWTTVLCGSWRRAALSTRSTNRKTFLVSLAACLVLDPGYTGPPRKSHFQGQPRDDCIPSFLSLQAIGTERLPKADDLIQGRSFKPVERRRFPQSLQLVHECGL